MDINDKFNLDKTEHSANRDALTQIEVDFLHNALKKTKDDSLVEKSAKTHDAPDNYKQDLKRLFDTEVQNTLDEEIKKARQDLLTEYQKVITQTVEEYKSLLKEMVEEEKKAIPDKVAELMKSLLLHLSE